MYTNDVSTDNNRRDKVADKFWVGCYRHMQPAPRGNLYGAVRRHMGLSQAQAAEAFGISLDAWSYRERTKRLYHAAEVLALHEFSRLDGNSFIKLLNDVA